MTEDGHESERLFKRPIWLRNEHLTWLDDQVKLLREEDRLGNSEITQISRSEVIRRLIDEKLAA